MQRAKCNYDNPADALFCMKCGARLEHRCTSCRTVNPADANFCRKCGTAFPTNTAIRHPVEPATASGFESSPERHPAEDFDGERKTVTALFADIKARWN